jgi:hypothetical protein
MVHTQLLLAQVLRRQRRDQAERRALREQTTALRTERARLQGELTALHARLKQVLGARWGHCREGEFPQEAGLAPAGFSVCPSQWASPKATQHPVDGHSPSGGVLVGPALALFGEAPWFMANPLTL